MTAIEKITEQETRKVELNSLHAKKTETKQEICRLNHELHEVSLALQRFERDHMDAYRQFNPESLEIDDRTQYGKLKTRSEDLYAQLLKLQNSLPEIAKQIEAAQEAASATIEIKAEEVVAQRTIVEQAKARAAKISKVIEVQKRLKEEGLHSIKENQAKVGAIHEDDLARLALGETNSVDAVEGVTRMSGQHYDKHRETVEKIESTIAGLTRRLEQAQHTVQNENRRLQALISTYLENDFHRCRIAYERAAAKAVDALHSAWGFHKILKRHDHPAGVNWSGGFSLPSFIGSRAGNSALYSERYLDQDRAEEMVLERLRKAGIIE